MNNETYKVTIKGLDFYMKTVPFAEFDIKKRAKMLWETNEMMGVEDSSWSTGEDGVWIIAIPLNGRADAKAQDRIGMLARTIEYHDGKNRSANHFMIRGASDFFGPEFLKTNKAGKVTSDRLLFVDNPCPVGEFKRICVDMLKGEKVDGKEVTEESVQVDKRGELISKLNAAILKAIDDDYSDLDFFVGSVNAELNKNYDVDGVFVCNIEREDIIEDISDKSYATDEEIAALYSVVCGDQPLDEVEENVVEENNYESIQPLYAEAAKLLDRILEASKTYPKDELEEILNDKNAKEINAFWNSFGNLNEYLDNL